MAGQRKLQEIRIFAASPGDVEHEREEGVRRVVQELDRGIAREKGFSMRVWTGRDVSPDLGRAQQIVLDQIGEYDIFVGVMGRRFGSPTGKYESGTEEEFQAARDLWQKSGRPRVLFYFKQDYGAGFQSRLEVQELERVFRFKESLQQQGLVQDFDSYEAFLDLLRRHLTDIILRRAAAPGPGLATEPAALAAERWPVWRDAMPEARQPGDSLETHLYRQAASSVKFMTISGRSMYNGRIEELLRAKSRGGFTLRLLLFDWNSPWIDDKLRDERRETFDEIDRARAKAAAITRQFLMLGSTEGLDLEIKLYADYPVFRMMVVDNRMAYVGYYPPGARGYEGPMLVLDSAEEAGYFYPMNQFFERLWLQSGPALEADDPRLEVAARSRR